MLDDNQIINALKEHIPKREPFKRTELQITNRNQFHKFQRELEQLTEIVFINITDNNITFNTPKVEEIVKGWQDQIKSGQWQWSGKTEGFDEEEFKDWLVKKVSVEICKISINGMVKNFLFGDKK
jgi:hypothetical protein